MSDTKFVYCGLCGGKNTPGYRFCGSCGAPAPSVKKEEKAPEVKPEPAKQDVKTTDSAEKSSTGSAFAPVSNESKAPVAPIKKTETKTSSGSAFAPVSEGGNTSPAPKKQPPKRPVFNPNPTPAKPPVSTYKEPDSVFADGLPSWDVMPPHIVVRSKRR